MTEHFVIEITWNDETMHSEEFEVDSLLQIGKKLVAISETLLSSWKEFSEESIDDDIRECDAIIEFLEKVERILNSMTFDIKNLTEIMKLELQ